MVAVGRVCCIAAPFLLSIAALITLVLVFLAGTYDKNKTLNDLYFMKVDLSNLTLTGTSSSLIGDALGTDASAIESALQAAKDSLGMNDYYTIYLRGYCHWNQGQDAYYNCTDPKAYFWFNPIKVWGLNNTGINIDDALPTGFNNAMDIYHNASKAIFYLYVGALSAAAITIVVGISAIFSRWGSFFTTFCATAMWVLFVAASATVTAVYVILRSALNEALEDEYGIKSTIGNSMLSNTWIGSAFAVGAGFFWFLSVCCCSGRSPYNPGSRESRRTRAEKTPYTYERVGSPYMGPGGGGGQQVPLANFGPSQNNQRGTAYEPFRPQHV